MKVMTFNVLTCGSAANHWTKRRQLVADMIRKYSPDTFGLQESHNRWMNYICSALPEYGYVGVGRDNGKRLGEFTPVFYKKDAFELVGEQHFWLSETPDVPGKGWDAKCVRICSFAVLKRRSDSRTFLHVNTHLDHVGETAQVRGAKLVLERIAAMPQMPVIVTGDFNVTPDSKVYSVMLEGGFTDARSAAEEKNLVPSFHHFGDASDMIDFIFVNDKITVKSAYTLTDTYDGRYPSDHYPVQAQIEFK